MKQISILLSLLMIVVAIYGIGLQGERYAQEGIELSRRGQYQRAIEMFNLADRAAGGSVPIYHYWLGKMHIAAGDSTTAIAFLGRYMDSEDNSAKTEAADLLEILQRQKLIFEKVDMRPLPSYISSRNSDYGTVVSPDGNFLYFTSLRPTRNEKENIWRSERLNTQWGRPRPVTELNTDKNESFGSFSMDGELAYIFGNYERGKIDGDIYLSALNNGRWGTPVNLESLNTSQVELHPTVFEDRLLFFASSREGGFGGMDIYVSEKIGDQWQEPINLGPNVNTAGNEQTPFFDFDGRTLFFASNAHPGFGGYDLFKVVKIGEEWTDWSLPENLGLPINSINNDRYFYRIKDSNEAFVSTDRGSDGFENIYSLYVVDAPPEYMIIDEESGKKKTVFITDEPDTDADITEDKPEEIIPRFFTIYGTVKDEDGNALQADVRFSYALADQKRIELAPTNSEGMFKITMPWTEYYDVTVNLDGYFMYSTNVKATDDEYELSIVMQRMKVDKVFVFNNIQFEFDSAKLKKDSTPILNEIVLTMLNNPEIKLEISGHTCDIGTQRYNQRLSLRRAQSVKKYLLSKEIEAERLSVKGYGLSVPLYPNTSEENRILNRRVELKVVE